MASVMHRRSARRGDPLTGENTFNSYQLRNQCNSQADLIERRGVGVIQVFVTARTESMNSVRLNGFLMITVLPEDAACSR